MNKYKAIVISGPPAAGKSTIGKRLSKELEIPFHSVGRMLRDKCDELYQRQASFQEFQAFMQRMPIGEHRKIDKELKRMFESFRIVGDSRYVSYLDPKNAYWF